MQRMKNLVLLLTIAILGFPLTTSSQSQQSQTRQEQPPEKPASKFLKGKKNPIPNRYIVILNDDVVSDSAPLHVRRAGVAAIAIRHAQKFHGTFDYIYETAIKGYAIELPNEAAAIAISELPEVKWVEQDSALMPLTISSFPERPACAGKRVPVVLLERPFGLKIVGARTSYLKGGLSRRARQVIRSREEFVELWNEITSSVQDKPPVPEVDFSREMLAVASTGPVKDFSELLIDSACEADDRVEILVRTITSFPCGASVGLPPHPVDIVRVPKTDLPVVFREIEETFDCRHLYAPPG